MIDKKQEIDFKSIFDTSQGGYPISYEEVVTAAFESMTQHCHAASHNRGWWHDPITELSLVPDGTAIEPGDQIIKAWFPYVIGTKIALIHSEVSEMLEAFRTDEMDDKIPFLGIVAEGADVFIRLFDLFGCLEEAAKQGIVVEGQYRVVAAMFAKIPVNATRVDHDFANRKKKF